MSNPYNEYAFPSHGSMGEVAQQGMTLRDYFAAKALQAMTQLHPTYATGPDSATAARRAYEIADAMLTHRSDGGGTP